MEVFPFLSTRRKGGFIQISTEVNNITEGKIVKLVRHRGFGFINTDDSEYEEDIFFHHSGLENVYFEDLSVGDELEFDINVTEKGPEAKEIKKIGLVNEDAFSDSDDDDPVSEDNLEEHLGW